ncbi:Integrase family protein [Candidatus Terasakiella magnetica]|nr:Integrase family protein [Candidatus Terasakiella magnetica]
MSVRKRILASGEIRWLVDYTDQSGNRRAKQFRRKKDADSFEIKAKGEVAVGVHVADSASITVAKAADVWIAMGQLDGLQATTILQRDQHVKLHIVPRIGTVKLSQLTAPRVEEFKDDLLRDLSRPMARAVLTSLKGIIRVARVKGLIGTNPAEAVKIVNRRAEDDGGDDETGGQVQVIAKDDLRAMLAKAPDLWPLARVSLGRHVRGQGRPEKRVLLPWRPLFVTAVFTGMRASELRGLTWSRVDLDAKVIRIRQRADRFGTLGPTKSATSKRDIPLAPMVVNALKEWRLVCPPSELDLVFPSESGRVILHTNLVMQGYRPLLKACKIDEAGYTFHALRHTAASLFIEQGWSPKKVQAVMGHSSITVTYDIYGHLFPSPDEDAEAMAQIQARLLG